MQTPTPSSDSVAGAPSADAAGSQSQDDARQKAVKTPEGVEFLHAGSGNSLGDGRTAGGSTNIASRDMLPDTNAHDDREDDGSACSNGSFAAQS